MNQEEGNPDEHDGTYDRSRLSRANKVSELVMDWNYAWEDLETMSDWQVDLFYSLATMLRRTPDVQDFIDRMLCEQRQLRYELRWTDSDEEWFRRQEEELWECGSCTSTLCTECDGDVYMPIVID